MSDLQTPGAKLAYRQSLAAFCQRLLAEAPGFSAYSNNYRGSHLRALETTFPVTDKQLGTGIFRSLGQAYLDHYPPRHWDLNLFGEHLAELIAAQVHGQRRDSAPWALIANIARIEYAMTCCYYAPDRDDDSRQALPMSVLSTRQHHASIARQLNAAHPYARVAATLSLELTVQVWRVNGQVRVDQPTPLPVAQS